MSIERSPADVLRLAVASTLLVALVVAEAIFGNTLVAFASDLFQGLAAIPDWIVHVVIVSTRVLALVVVGGGLIWTVVKQRWRMLATIGVAAAAALGLAAVVEALVGDDEGRAPVDVDGLGPITADGFPGWIGLAAVIAGLTAAAPWLSRRWRRLGWALAVGLIFCAFIDAEVSFAPFNAAACGWFAGAAALVATGAPSRRPSAEAVQFGLAAVGLPLESLEVASVDARGSTPYFGVGTDGGRLFVKVLGDDERSADLLFRFYRRIQPRDFGDEKPFSTLRRAVEHEALLALAAADLGVRTPRMRALATAEPNGFVLAYEAIAGRSLDRLEPDELTDAVLAAIWALLDQLRQHRIAHRDLRLANVFLDDTGEAWLIDFGFSELAARDLLLATDVAELLASTSVTVGAERAVGHAAASVESATLAAARDRLRLPALSGATRTAMKARPGLLDELRRRVDDVVAPGGLATTQP